MSTRFLQQRDKSIRGPANKFTISSVLTSNEHSSKADSISYVTSTVVQTASVQATPNVVVAKPARVRFFTEERIVLLNKVILSGVPIVGYRKKKKRLKRQSRKSTQIRTFAYWSRRARWKTSSKISSKSFASMIPGPARLQALWMT